MSYDPARIRSGPQTDPQGPIRVLFVSHDSGMYGAQRTLLTFLSVIDRRICSPMLVIPNEGLMGRAAAKLGIPVFVERLVHWLPGYHVSSKRRRLRYLYHFLRTLNLRSRTIEGLIANHGVDLVYTNTVTCVEGAIAAWRTRKPHIWHIHEHVLRNQGLTPVFPYQLYCAAVKYLSKSIVFCSMALARDYPQLSKKASVIHSGIPIPQLRDRLAARAEVTKNFSIDADSKLVAVVGAIQPNKGHLTFLAAAEQVAKKVDKVDFLIVGLGFDWYENFLRQKIKELQIEARVKLLGWCEGIFDLLAAIDVLVISSEQESFGLTAIEALAMETPVVATRCGGPEESITDGVTGLLVPVNDPLSMANAIVRLLQDANLARRLGVSGRNHVSEYFGIDRYVQSIQLVIQESVS